MRAAHPRILVISLRRIGDLLLTTPLIRSLRRAWPDSEIDVLVFDNTRGIVAGNPDINHVITMPQRPTLAESARLFVKLWRRYDVAISTQSGDRPIAFAFAAGRMRVGVTTDDDPWLARTLKRIALHRRGGRRGKAFIASSRCCALPTRSTLRASRTWSALRRRQARRPLRPATTQ